MNRTLNLNIVSTYRAPLYGFAILWIVLFHGWAIDKVDWSFGEGFSWLALFMEHGNVGVDMFLLLSGISLYRSWHGNPDIHDYFVKRFVRLALPVFVIDGVYWLVRYVVLQDGTGVVGFIDRMLLLRFWETGDQQIWYVSVLLVFYLLYPFIHEIIFSSDNPWHTALRTIGLMSIVYVAVICFKADAPELYDMVEIGLTRLPVFILGTAMGRAVNQGMKLPVACALVPIVGVAVVFGVWSLDVLHNPWSRFFYLVGGVSISYALAMLFGGLDKLRHGKSLALRAFSPFGDISLELYLSHIMVNQVYRLSPVYIEGDLPRYLVVALIAVALAFAANKLVVSPVSKRLLAKVRKNERTAKHKA